MSFGGIGSGGGGGGSSFVGGVPLLTGASQKGAANKRFHSSRLSSSSSSSSSSSFFDLYKLYSNEFNSDTDWQRAKTRMRRISAPSVSSVCLSACLSRDNSKVRQNWAEELLLSRINLLLVLQNALSFLVRPQFGPHTRRTRVVRPLIKAEANKTSLYVSRASKSSPLSAVPGHQCEHEWC